MSFLLDAWCEPDTDPKYLGIFCEQNSKHRVLPVVYSYLQQLPEQLL